MIEFEKKNAFQFSQAMNYIKQKAKYLTARKFFDGVSGFLFLDILKLTGIANTFKGVCD